MLSPPKNCIRLTGGCIISPSLVTEKRRKILANKVMDGNIKDDGQMLEMDTQKFRPAGGHTKQVSLR